MNIKCQVIKTLFFFYLNKKSYTGTCSICAFCQHRLVSSYTYHTEIIIIFTIYFSVLKNTANPIDECCQSLKLSLDRIGYNDWHAGNVLTKFVEIIVEKIFVTTLNLNIGIL